MSLLRLRQVCVVASNLAQAVEDYSAIFDAPVCFRDPNLARYGLENAIFRAGFGFIEIVAPLRPGTAAERFMLQRQGVGGYMLIFDCDEPLARMARAASLGIRTANLVEHDDYVGVQLHPRDTGATMIEFNRTTGTGPIEGPYHPAGSAWQSCSSGEVLAMGPATVRAPDPAQLADVWSRLMQRPLVGAGDASIVLRTDAGDVRFVATDAGQEALFTGITLRVRDPQAVERRAHARGCAVAGGAIRYCGVDITLEGDDSDAGAAPA